MNFVSKKIMVVDDSKFMLNILEGVFRQEGFKEINKVSSGELAVRMAKDWKPDVILLDIIMPDMSGYEVCTSIRDFSMVPILFLSGKEDESDKLISFAMGGDDYITKPFSHKELVARVKALLRRTEYYEQKCDSNIVFGGYELDKSRRELYRDSKVVPLTTKEYELLEYLIGNEDITVSKEHILEHVWGYGYDGYDNTVMVHIRHLREKIEKEPSHPKYIVTVRGRGYRFENKMV